ncbi:protein shisa-4-like isoform X2 [Ptychodera flava]|uniref:protein shisa-4-like isoform X2 n=1 Tax=Ptychodera flava TaxID=63121 RepID=UPI00396A0D62
MSPLTTCRGCFEYSSHCIDRWYESVNILLKDKMALTVGIGVVIFISNLFISGVHGEYCSSYYDSYGTYHLGFTCPTVFDWYDETYCCGSYNNKYCCGYTEWLSNDYDGGVDNAIRLGVGIIFGIVFGVIVFIVIIVAAIAKFVCKLGSSNRTTVIRTGGAASAAPVVLSHTNTTNFVPTVSQSVMPPSNPVPPPSYQDTYPTGFQQYPPPQPVDNQVPGSMYSNPSAGIDPAYPPPQSFKPTY